MTFFGALGSDHFGDILRTTLAETGLDLSHLQRLPGSTGVALILVDEQAENVIAVAPGTNGQLAPDLGTLAKHLTRETVLLTQLEIPLGTCLAVIEHAAVAGARIVVNAAPLTDPADPKLHELLRRTDVLVVNETEAAALAGGSSETAVSDGPEELACEIRNLGPDAVVVTVGADGAFLADPQGACGIPSVPVNAVDSTGAGDAFCGALAAALAAGAPLRQAVRRACIAGALATTAVGAQEALPSAADLTAWQR